MAADIYTKEVMGTQEMAVASATIKEGDIITLESGGGCHRTDPSSDGVADGIVPHMERGPHLPEHDEDFTPVEYNSDEQVPYRELHQVGKLMPFTVRENTMTAPDIARHDVVGIITGDSGRPVAVQEGYSHGGTTYGRSSAGDFLALGLAEEYVTDHFEQVTVNVRPQLMATR